MGDMSKIAEAAPATPAAVRIPVEAYISEEYARAERDKLWRKVWLQAGRVEDLPKVGSYVTYDILDDSVLIVRTAPDRIKAYHNVCTHRGRKLIDTPKGERNAHGERKSFVCGFHAWTFDIEGKCTYIQAENEWGGALCDEVTRLGMRRGKGDPWVSTTDYAVADLGTGSGAIASVVKTANSGIANRKQRTTTSPP